MHADQTPVQRVIDFSQVTTGVGGTAMCRRGILDFVKGIRGPRQNPVSFKQISTWLWATPDDFIHECLDDLLAAKTIVILRTGMNRKRHAYRYTLSSRER